MADDLKTRVVAALRTVYDPEIPLNIYDLGLIYGVDLESSGQVHIRMTLTSPACPVAGALPGQIKAKVQAVGGVADADVELVWDPPWSPAAMSEAARLQLGFDDPPRPRGSFVPASTLVRDQHRSPK
jgi:FeS assembly SUF system protein